MRPKMSQSPRTILTFFLQYEWQPPILRDKGTYAEVDFGLVLLFKIASQPNFYFFAFLRKFYSQHYSCLLCALAQTSDYQVPVYSGTILVVAGSTVALSPPSPHWSCTRQHLETRQQSNWNATISIGTVTYQELAKQTKCQTEHSMVSANREVPAIEVNPIQPAANWIQFDFNSCFLSFCEFFY